MNIHVFNYAIYYLVIDFGKKLLSFLFLKFYNENEMNKWSIE